MSLYTHKVHHFPNQNQKSWLLNQNACSKSEMLALIHKWIYVTCIIDVLGPFQ